jgi:membrane protease YdiL (CAAX protease family)
LHFLRPARIDTGAEVTWLSGWEQLLMIFHGAPPWPLLGYGIFTLLLAGGILAWVTLRTRSLWGAIGLHAGWILGQQGFLAVARLRVKPEEALLPWVGPNLVSGAVPTGIVPAAVLAFTGLLLWVLWRRR